MSKYIFLSLIILLLILNLALVLKIHSLKTDEFRTREKNDFNEIFYNKSLIEIENENLKMSDSLKILDLNGDTILAKNLFNRKILVFRYSILNCSDCINAEFEILVNELLSHEKIIENVCLLAYYDNSRGLIDDFRKFQHKNIKIQLFILPVNQLDIPIEIQNIPYYFTIDQSLIMHNFFIPMKERPQWSLSYLRLILNNYFK